MPNRTADIAPSTRFRFRKNGRPERPPARFLFWRAFFFFLSVVQRIRQHQRQTCTSIADTESETPLIITALVSFSVFFTHTPPHGGWRVNLHLGLTGSNSPLHFTITIISPLIITMALNVHTLPQSSS